MILFHGTTEFFIKGVRDKGLISREPLFGGSECDLFHGVIAEKDRVFFSSQPSAGPGGSPRDYANAWRKFAGCWYKGWEGDGYLVVVELPPEKMKKYVIAIFDNEVLQGYHKLHAHWFYIYFNHVLAETWGTPKEFEQAQRERFAGEAAYVSLDPPCMYMKPDWLRGKMLKRATRNCQVLTRSIPRDYIIDIIRVFTKEGDYVPEFNPRNQKKEKHKSKTFNDLVWHRVLEKKKQIKTGCK